MCQRIPTTMPPSVCARQSDSRALRCNLMAAPANVCLRVPPGASGWAIAFCLRLPNGGGGGHRCVAMKMARVRLKMTVNAKTVRNAQPRLLCRLHVPVYKGPGHRTCRLISTAVSNLRPAKLAASLGYTLRHTPRVPAGSLLSFTFPWDCPPPFSRQGGNHAFTSTGRWVVPRAASR